MSPTLAETPESSRSGTLRQELGQRHRPVRRRSAQGLLLPIIPATTHLSGGAQDQLLSITWCPHDPDPATRPKSPGLEIPVWFHVRSGRRAVPGLLLIAEKFGTMNVRDSKPAMSFARRSPKVARVSARGAVMVEYAFLLTTVSVMFVLGITAAGKALLTQYQEGRAVLMLPVP